MANSGRCSLCGVFRNQLHRDHVVPRFLGGADTPENIQYICANCHEDKSLTEVRSPAFRQTVGPKISAKLTGRTFTSAWREKLSKAAQRRSFSVETRERMRLSHLGKGHSEDSRRKIGAAQVARWAARKKGELRG